jgi:molybdate/tungstate transport system substrate-binding protein
MTRFRAKGSAVKKSVLGCLLGLGLSLVSLAASAEDQKVDVMYAGSLVHLMETGVGPAFQKATGVQFAGYAGGSNKLANEIKGKLRRADVFISASPKVNDSLMGKENGDWVQGYVVFAQSPVQIGYNAKSKFAPLLKTMRWDKVLQQPGVHIGRTDPTLDPKGKFTVDLVTAAAKLYQQPDLLERTLGSPTNPEQVLPEETLVGRLQSGQLDIGFFYSTETSDLKIPAINLPPELQVKADYTITVLNDAPHREAALKFVQFLMSPAGIEQLKAHGVDVVKPSIKGNLPADVSKVLPAGHQ